MEMNMETRDDAEMNKVLEKLQKIKAHADSAEKIGSQAEAEAFASMLQKLLIKHKLSMTDLEVELSEKAEPVDWSDVDWLDVKVRGSRIAWIERLAQFVAKAYFCRILVTAKSSRITLVGRESDRKIAEYMIVTLTRLAEKLAKKEFGVLYRQDRYAAHGFKDSFLKAFVMRIAQRLEEERGEAVGSTSTALVRINRAEQAVADFMNARGVKKAAIVRGSRQDPNAHGLRRGREVADSLSLRSNAVDAGSTTARLKA